MLSQTLIVIYIFLKWKHNFYVHDKCFIRVLIVNFTCCVILCCLYFVKRLDNVSQAFGALTCIPVGILSDQYFNSRRKPFVYISCLLLAIGFLNITNCNNLTQMTGVCMILGAANGAYLTMDTSLAVDTLEVDEDNTAEPEPESMMKSKSKQTESPQHQEGAAQMLGIWGVFGFLGSSLGSVTGATVLLTAGNSDDASSSDDGGAMKYYTLHGYMILFSLSAFYFACSAISLTFVTKKGV